MAVRSDPVLDATRRAQRQVQAVLDDARAARKNAGLSMTRVAHALGCSRQLIGLLERGGLEDIGTMQLARYCAAVGLDFPIRAFPGGAPLRDIGQVRLLERFFEAIGDDWRIRTEVPINADPLDRRAVDALLIGPGRRVGVEGITRLSDSQAQSRATLLKQEALGVGTMVLVLNATRHNRFALADAGAPLRAAFPLSTRAVLGALRRGEQPSANGIVLI